MSRPVFLVLSPDGEALAADLRRRYDADYRTVVVPGRDQLLAALREVTDPVALMIVDERAEDAFGLFDSGRSFHPDVLRILLVERGQWSATHPAVGAMALGRFDYHLFRPWWPLERILYGSMAEFLSAWENTQPPVAVAFRIVGEPQSTAAHQLRDVLTRIGIPYRFYDAGSPEGRLLLREVGTDRIPIVMARDGRVLIQPTHAEFTAWFGIPRRPPIQSCDVAIAGAGPAGLAAAVYAASEGLRTVLLEPAVPGGQAGTSALIRNYLGFPRGVSGFELTNRALEQAWLFGAHMVVAAGATRITVDGDRRLVETGEGPPLAARAVVIATGVSWRRLGVPSLEALIGAGVFYGAAGAEALAVEGRRAYVVGAGNSAGQAALHLAKHAATVTLVVRGATLANTMSEYLITEIAAHPTIAVRLRTEISGGGGAHHLERLELRDRDSGVVTMEEASALFVMIGAAPRTEWLAGFVDRDEQGFIRTGGSGLSLETSVPGVFAAGDVRAGSVKRVASAVGEGATAIQQIHRYLA